MIQKTDAIDAIRGNGTYNSLKKFKTSVSKSSASQSWSTCLTNSRSVSSGSIEPNSHQARLYRVVWGLEREEKSGREQENS